MSSTRFPTVFERPSDGVSKILFRASNALQSAELNELQTIIQKRISQGFGVLFKDGAILDGGEILVLPEVDEDGHNIQITAGKFYFASGVNDMPGVLLEIPFDTRVFVGVRYRETEIDETDDVTLRDPAEGTGNYMEPGAARIKQEMYWGYAGDDGSTDARGTWEFYPIFEVDHGVIIVKAPPSVADPYLELLAKYDREANGSYVVDDLTVHFVETAEDGKHIFEVAKGLANIHGYKFERKASTRLALEQNADTNSVNNEPHTFTPDINGQFQLFTNRAPIATLGEIIGVKSKTVEVTHGIANGTDEDAIPDPSVLAVTRVFQGGTTYVATRDYTISGDDIVWSPDGEDALEPAPGTTYQVEYTYQTTVEPVEQGLDYLVFSGLVNGSTVQVDYTYKLPRMDLVVMNLEGNILRIQGIPQVRNPYAPSPAFGQIALATIYFDWVNDPVVANIAIRAIPMNEIEEMRGQIYDLYDLVAQERLKGEVALNDPSSKLGVFVDPFFNDNQRDQGTAQTAAIYLSMLQMPITPELVEPSIAAAFNGVHMLPFVLEPIITQPNMTACMKINPYMAFSPPPAKVTLTPSVDNWVQYDDQWTSGTTSKIEKGKGWNVTVKKEVRTNVLSQTSEKLPFIRPRTVAFVVDGFAANETLAEITMGGVPITIPA